MLPDTAQINEISEFVGVTKQFIKNQDAINAKYDKRMDKIEDKIESESANINKRIQTNDNARIRITSYLVAGYATLTFIFFIYTTFFK